MSTPNGRIYPPRVYLESPYSGDIKTNVLYALYCMEDSYISHGEAPFTSHLLYTRMPNLNAGYSSGHVPDGDPVYNRLGREHGMECGFSWASAASKTVVYTDRGISPGMIEGIHRAQEEGRPIEYRKLGKRWLDHLAKTHPELLGGSQYEKLEKELFEMQKDETGLPELSTSESDTD